jgi:histone H3/H4
VVVLAAGAYGAGLLMNHSDVPKGTTVLGVDIGGGTRDDAVKKLDEAFGKRVDQPLKLTVDGDTVTLKPDQAGLQFDEDATVGAAAKSDYNPVSVIGSLFGQQRVVEPVMPVDEEKLQAALEDAAGGAGSASDGTIRFQAGKAVAVYGKAGKGIDVAGSKEAVQRAYRTQVETGATTPVTVPTVTRQPTVSNAEVDRMMKEFAEPAMSAKVTVQTDAVHTVSFSPEKSIWKFLRVKAVNGKLVDSYDEAALKQLYGKTFDGVLIARADGRKTPVTVEDVYGALRLALKSTTDRVAVIDTDPS